MASAAVAALAQIPAGAGLAVALAQLDLSALTGYEMVLVLRARYRQGNHDRAMLLVTLAEVMRRTDPDYGRVILDSGDEVAAHEIRAALTLTRPAANALAGLARDLTVRLPAVLSAMHTGQLDQPRARIFSLWTAELDDPHARAVVEALLPVAPTLTTAGLVQAIQKAIIELDPDWARRRYENALKARDVRGAIDTDGTATLTGSRLPADQVAAICNRLDALAHAVKRAGHPALLRHLRADIFCGKLDGRYTAMTEDQIYTHLLADITPTPPPHSTQDEQPTESGTGQQHHPDRPNTGEPHDPDRPDTGEAHDPDRSQDSSPHEPADAVPDPPTDGGPPAGRTDAAAGEPGAGDPRPGRATQGRGLRLSVGLTTIAGLDRRPGELLGVGLLHAELARRVAAAPGASWRYVITTPEGTPLDVGPIRRRPTTTTTWYHGPRPTYRNVEVWLHATAGELATLAHHPPPGWAALLTDLTHRSTQRPGGPPNGDPTDRLPNAALRRWIAIRDRHCVFPGCRTAAHHCDADHTREYATGGPTTDTNLGNACRPHHALRHTGGWHLHQPRPGHFIWTSPLGHHYLRPAPSARRHPMLTPSDPAHDHFNIWVNETINYHPDETCLSVDAPAQPRTQTTDEPQPPRPDPPRGPPPY